MAKVQVLGQRCPHGNKMLIRGVFTQKKKLWEAMEKEAGDIPLSDMTLVDDITGSASAATYNGLCSKLRQIGRATLVAPDGKKEFQVVDAVTNQIRGWDVDDEGPVCNPAK